MDSFLEKSTQTLKSAELLVKQAHFSCSVNRSYYASLQFIFHILFEKLGLDKEEYYRNVQEDSKLSGGTHSQALLLIRQAIQHNYSSYKTFNKNFPELKKRRIIADYKTTVLGSDDGHLSIDEAKRIIRCLTEGYKK